ncbi:hypothetical protein AYK24_09865 [Thermoplasmatales archaeon SG8-52-4]|nr:MAG: hypothetical protein AYK24_09865 [Thermoplasmatales archaeon SG8-52-4]
MIVTRFNYHLDKNLLKKIDLMIERCITDKSKKDSLLLIEGGEGEGKTTFSIAIGYYVSEKTGRPFSHKNIFFDAEKMIDFAKKTENQIIIWDEPALQGLSTDWASRIVKNLTRLLMTARKKRHFFIFNMTKFFKFNEYIVVDRACGMIHVYSRKNVESGRFRYIKKANLQPLWRDYRYSKKRNYVKYSAPHILGNFPDILSPNYPNNVLSEFNVDAYEKKKDEGIESIGSKEERLTPLQIEKKVHLKVVRNSKKKGFKLKQKELAQLLDVNVSSIKRYAKETQVSKLSSSPLL